MKKLLPVITAALFTLAADCARAENKVVIDYNSSDEATQEFNFKTVPPPLARNAAISAQFKILDGSVDSNGGGLEKLHDGKLPGEADEPDENFFFQAGTDGGRIQVDLGSAINIKQVNTYSWHPGSRGPQVYDLYASDGLSEHFNLTPTKGTSPTQSGWTFLAKVNTKPKSESGGGQYGVSISGTNGGLGQFRYLLFDIAATEHDDAFGNTFYSEIAVIDANAPTNVSAAVSPVVTESFSVKTSDGACTITLDTTKAPELKDWAEHQMGPTLAEWYPKIVAMLPSEGFSAPTRFKVTFKPVEGVAYTTGHNVVANSSWIKKEIGREAIGSIVHEAVHVVQQYGRHGGHNPGWLVEGIADYIRFFKYEPKSHGADNVWAQRQRHNSLKYDGAYRSTANFLNWVTEKYDTNIVAQLNADMRSGTYSNALWMQYAGKSAPDLGAEWKAELDAQFAKAATTNKTN